MMKRSRVLSFFAGAFASVTVGSTAFAAADAVAYLQTAPNVIVITRYQGGVYKRCTSANTAKVKWCPDAASYASATSDTTSECTFLTYNTTARGWMLREGQLTPTSDFGRRAGTVSLSNGAGTDTTVQIGWIPDALHPGEQCVDTFAIEDLAVTPIKVDSTGTFFLNEVESERLELRERGNGERGVWAPYGTSHAGGNVVEIGGSGTSTGKALYVRDWSGPALTVTRAASVAGAYDAISVDLSADTDTSAIRDGLDIVYGGDVKARGIYLSRSSGTATWDAYGLQIAAGGTSESGLVNYGARITANATVSGTSRNVGLRLTSTAAADGRALWTDAGDVQIGDSGDTSDSLLVFTRAKFNAGINVVGNLYTSGTVDAASPWSGTALVDLGSATEVVTVTGMDATNYHVFLTPLEATGIDWWVVKAADQFTITQSGNATGDGFSYDYLVVKKH